LRGKAGTPVRLKIARYGEDQPIEVAIVREAISNSRRAHQVRVEDGKLMVSGTGKWAVLDFDKDKPVPVTAISDTEFSLRGRRGTRLSFARDTSVLNPGPWQIEGTRLH